jgi:hypothetical protein
MKDIIIIAALAFIALAAVSMGIACMAKHLKATGKSSLRKIAVNIAEGTHDGTLSKLTDAAVSTRYLMAKIGSTWDHAAIGTQADKPIGVYLDEVSSAEVGERRAIALLGGTQTLKMVAGGVVSNGDELVTTAAGKVIDAADASTAGTYWLVGTAINLSADAADGDAIEVASRQPIKLVVIANGSTLAQTQAAMNGPNLVRVL